MPRKKKAAKPKPRRRIDGIPVWCNFDQIKAVGSMKPNPDNPNSHPEDQIQALAILIKAHEWRHPITVSNQSGMIVRGHGRLQAAISAGLKKVPVEFQDYESVEAEVLDLIADNKIAEFSEVDDEAAMAMIDALGDLNWDVDVKVLAGMIPAVAGDSDTGGGSGGDPGPEKPEVEFTQELTEARNYVVLVFDNDMDWLQAQTIFELQTVKSLSSKPGFEMKGIGRVIDGAQALNKIMGMI